MALLEVPTKSELLKYRETVTFENINFILEFSFNNRLELWVMNILDIESNDLLNGIPLQTDVDLTPYANHLNIPKGLFLLFDTEGIQKDANVEDLGQRVRFYYEET